MSFHFDDDFDGKESFEDWSQHLNREEEKKDSELEGEDGSSDKEVDWGDGSDEDDAINWEDGEDEDDKDNAEARVVPKEAVTINLRAKEDKPEKPKQKKRKRKRSIRLEKLSNHEQTVLWNLHRSHVLSMTSRVVWFSSLADELQGTVLSLWAGETPQNTRPSTEEVKRLTFAIMHRIKQAPSNRLARMRANRAAGAPIANENQGHAEFSLLERLEAYAVSHLSETQTDPQLHLFVREEASWFPLILIVALSRALGWRARVVVAFGSIPLDLNEDHPMIHVNGKSSQTNKVSSATPEMYWMEVLCSSSLSGPNTWTHADPQHGLVDSPKAITKLWQRVQGSRKVALSYALAVEHSNDHYQVTDVTPRYSSSMIASMRLRGLVRGKQVVSDSWWLNSLAVINNWVASDQFCEDAISVVDSDEEDKKPAAKSDSTLEAEELSKLASFETIPTTKAAFHSHPLYVIPSTLGFNQVIHPQAQLCGLVKGERVYKRSDVSTALPARKWPYQGRKVRSQEKPVKRVKARKKPARKGFQALDSYCATSDSTEVNNEESDGMESLYAEWQTEAWSPPRVGPGDEIPVNKFNNVELQLLNPGLVHVDVKGSAKVAKKLGIQYAPCLLGFEGHGDNRTPTIRGIVVHTHNEELVRSAVAEVSQFEEADRVEKWRNKVMKRWKKLMLGLLTQDRLEREYGDER